MKRTIINALSVVFALALLVWKKSLGNDVSSNQKAIFFGLIFGLIIIRVLGELLYLWFVRRMLNTSAADSVPLWSGLKTIKDKEFACPHCGRRFKKTWWHYTFSFLKHRAIALSGFGKTNFRCPHCKKFDTCVVVDKNEV